MIKNYRKKKRLNINKEISEEEFVRDHKIK